jgi:hypothetical protein
MERHSKLKTKLKRSNQGNIENKENVDPLRPTVTKRHFGVNNHDSISNSGYSNLEEDSFQFNFQKQTGTEESISGKLNKINFNYKNILNRAILKQHYENFSNNYKF